MVQIVNNSEQVTLALLAIAHSYVNLLWSQIPVMKNLILKN